MLIAPAAPEDHHVARFQFSLLLLPGADLRLGDLRRGDRILLYDTRRDREVRFAVTSARSYSLAEAATPAVLKRIYGVGPAVGQWPQPSADGLSPVGVEASELG